MHISRLLQIQFSQESQTSNKTYNDNSCMTSNPLLSSRAIGTDSCKVTSRHIQTSYSVKTKGSQYKEPSLVDTPSAPIGDQAEGTNTEEQEEQTTVETNNYASALTREQDEKITAYIDKMTEPLFNSLRFHSCDSDVT